MMHGRNNGKKLMAVRIVAHAFEIVSLPPTSPKTRCPARRLPHPGHMRAHTAH